MTSSTTFQYVQDRTAEMVQAAEQKIQATSALRANLTKWLDHLDTLPRTATLRHYLIAVQIELSQFEAAEQTFLADALQVRREVTK